MKDRKS